MNGRSLGPMVTLVLDETPTSAPVLSLIELGKTSSSLPYSGAGMQKKCAPPFLFTPVSGPDIYGRLSAILYQNGHKLFWLARWHFCYNP